MCEMLWFLPRQSYPGGWGRVGSGNDNKPLDCDGTCCSSLCGVLMVDHHSPDALARGASERLVGTEAERGRKRSAVLMMLMMTGDALGEGRKISGQRKEKDSRKGRACESGLVAGGRRRWGGVLGCSGEVASFCGTAGWKEQRARAGVRLRRLQASQGGSSDSAPLTRRSHSERGVGRMRGEARNGAPQMRGE